MPDAKAESPSRYTRAPVLVELAEWHVGSNVKAEHDGPVGLAIVMTFGKTRGPLFHEQTKAAWVERWSLHSGNRDDALKDRV